MNRAFFREGRRAKSLSLRRNPLGRRRRFSRRKTRDCRRVLGDCSGVRSAVGAPSVRPCEIVVGRVKVVRVRHLFRVSHPRRSDVRRVRRKKFARTRPAKIVKKPLPLRKPRPKHNPRERRSQVRRRPASTCDNIRARVALRLEKLFIQLLPKFREKRNQTRSLPFGIANQKRSALPIDVFPTRRRRLRRTAKPADSTKREIRSVRRS